MQEKTCSKQTGLTSKFNERNLKRSQFTTQCFDTPIELAIFNNLNHIIIIVQGIIVTFDNIAMY
jgi:hypothetical protein